MLNNRLFYLENRINLLNHKTQLVLFDVTKFLQYFPEIINTEDYDVEINLEKFLSGTESFNSDNILSDLYTSFIRLENGKYVSANMEQTARKIIRINSQIRYDLIDNNLNFNPKEYLLSLSQNYNNKSVFSYYINVGHGNCSIIYNQGQIIVIDCSDYDISQKRRYTNNIENCINKIKSRFHLSSFHIDLFLLTHPHFDHYSGIEYLLKKNYIDKSTVFCMNEYYSFQGILYTRILNKIKNLGCKIFEPKADNSNIFFEILYPLKTVIKKPSNAPTIDDNDKIVEPNPNNVSFVSLFDLAGKKILFPDDLETEGWDNIKPCNICNYNINYYAVSHHSSITGFERTKCKKNKKIKNITACLSEDVNAIVMGRDGAYSGIYNPVVINAFKNMYYSEKDNNGKSACFLEIDLTKNVYTWY